MRWRCQHGLMDDLKRFAAWFISLVTVFGGIVLARDRDLEVEFIALVVIALLGVIVPKMWRRLGRWITAVRAYPRLLERIAELTELTESQERDLSALQELRDRAYLEGKRDGDSALRGGVLAHFLKEVPQLVGVTDSDGEAVLVATFTDEAPVTRLGLSFSVEDSLGEEKGIVVVDSINSERQQITLRCRERTVRRFWEVLDERAALDSSLPPDLSLSPFIPPALDLDIVREEGGSDR